MTFKHTIVAFAVWGEAHRQRFIDYALPSLLNALPDDGGRALKPRLLIFTTSTDAAWLKDEMSKESIRDLMFDRMAIGAPEPEIIRFIPGDHDGTSMVSCQKEALRIAWAEKSALSWMYPDCWVMPGSFDAIDSHVRQHARACMYQTFTVFEDDAKHAIAIRHTPWQNESPRAIGWDMLRHIHPTSTARSWDDAGHLTGKTRHPGMLYRLPTEEAPIMVMNSVHLAPMWVQPRRLAVDFETSMDGDFIEVAGLSIEEIDVLTRGFFCVELAPPSKIDFQDAHLGFAARPLNREEIRKWMTANTTPINRLLFGRPIIMARNPEVKIAAAAEAELLGRLTFNARELARL